MKFFGILFELYRRTGRRDRRHPQRGRIPRDRPGNEGSLDRPAGRQDRRDRRQNPSPQRRAHHRRQRPARLSGHDRFRHRAGPLGSLRGPRNRRHRRTRRVHAAVARAQRSQSGERTLRRGARQRNHQRDDLPLFGRRRWRRRRPFRRRRAPVHLRPGRPHPHRRLDLGRHGHRSYRRHPPDLPHSRRTGRTRRRRCRTWSSK